MACGLFLSACSSKQPRLLADPAAAQMGAPTPQGQAALQEASRSPVGIWSGHDGTQPITLKIGERGELIFSNEAGTEAGRWTQRSRGRYEIVVAGVHGSLICVDPQTGSFTLDNSTIEMTRK